MIREEYEKYADENSDWAPGWEAIDGCLETLYQNQKPCHYGSLMNERAVFGGDQYLDGFSIYQSANGYKHIVTYGMSELYSNADAFGGEYSKWGYEMTMKLAADTNDECLWAIDMLSNLARYTYTKSVFFQPFEYIAGNGAPIKTDSNSKLTALIVVQDTELKEIDTIHGKLDFMQLVGITQKELEAIKENPDFCKELVEIMKKDNPMLITDLSRKNDYI